LVLECKILTRQIWAIEEIIVSTLALVVSSCVLNQRRGYWLLSDAFANILNLCVNLTNEGLELEIRMSFILASQFDAKLFLLTRKMQLEVTCVFVSFMDCLRQFDPKNSHMMLVLMLDPKFKDIFILSNYVKIKKPQL
jgi:hypothetical protein